MRTSKRIRNRTHHRQHRTLERPKRLATALVVREVRIFICGNFWKVIQCQFSNWTFCKHWLFEDSKNCYFKFQELLATPQTHGTAIRWLDRNRGVFKIEDSVRVARLWGRRKNRPAMNYDKLSRSIRQYYKKGIMKKTERSQRLVYQFCTPYSMWIL